MESSFAALSPMDRVRSSCAYAAEHSKFVKISTEAIDRLIHDNPVIECDLRTLAMPLRFDSVDHEVNFYCLYSVLQIGSGFRKELHAAVDAGAADTITRGLISLVISGSKLDASSMSAFTESEFIQSFGVNIMVEKPHETIPGLYISSKSILSQFAQKVVFTFNDCGRVLRELGHADFASLVRSCMKSNGPFAGPLIEFLVTKFKAFNDTGLLHDGVTPLYFYKKAQLLVGEIHRNIGSEHPEFKFEDVDKLTVFVDNVIPAVLRAEGVLVYDEELARKIDAGEKLPAGPEECEIRAVAIAASEQIIAKYNASHDEGKKLTGEALDYWLWRRGKEPQFRSLERHATIDTIYY